MKAKFYLVAGLSALMLGACSDDSTLDTPQGQEQTVQKDGIMNINLKFVGNAGSRAGDGTFEDGTAEESNIQDVTIYYFQPDGTCLGEGSVNTFTEGAGTKPNVTKTLTAQVPADVVGKIQQNSSVNIIVVLNKPTGFMSTAPQNFNSFNAALTAQGNAGYMMSSSTYCLSDAQANSQNQVKYFTSITEANIGEVGTHPTPVHVYVERVCSKVTLTKNNGMTTPQGVTFALQSWGLHQCNTKVFPVKKLANTIDLDWIPTDPQQESDDSWIWPGKTFWTNDVAESKFRCYWAVDPNYQNPSSTGAAAGATSSEFTAAQFSRFTNLGEPLYCLENTMEATLQTQDHTTSAVLLAQYQPIIESNSVTGDWVMQNNAIYTLDTYVSNFLAYQKIYKIKMQNQGSTEYETASYNDVDFSYTPIKITNATGKATIGGKDYKIAEKSQSSTKLYQYDPTATEEAKKYKELDANSYTQLTKAFAKYAETASIYVNGYCYYVIPIQHFGDNVPLVKSSIQDVSEWAGIYNDHHLGRYGVVRNHHYKLDVTSVTKVGKPIKNSNVEISTETDDPTKDQYLTVKINVLSWAVRTQDVEL